MERISIKKTAQDLLYFSAGCAVYSAAVEMFISPAALTPGGISGLGMLLELKTGIPIGLTVFLLNLPLLLICYGKFGRAFIAKTAVCVFLLSLFLELATLLPPIQTDRILAGLFGGVMTGFGISLVLLRGGTTGGVDTLAHLLHSYRPSLTVGRIFLFCDAGVILLTALYFRDVTSALYSAVSLYLSSRLIDAILYGGDKGKVIYILSSHHDQISRALLIEIGRGVTVIPVWGAYTGRDGRMLMCAVRREEVAAVRQTVYRIDEHAFTMICEAGDITGEGFQKTGIDK